jgi:osmotically inducible protein OsmC
VSFPKRAAEDADGTTSPEELIAAAHSSCYAMSFSGLVARAGGTPRSVEVTSDVTVTKDDKGLRINKIHLTVRAEVEGLDEEQFQKAAQDAKAGCPVSKALAGVDEMTLDASME